MTAMRRNVTVPQADQDIKDTHVSTDFGDLIQRLHSEQDDYIDTNVTDQASTNAHLKVLSKLVAECCRKLGISPDGAGGS